MVKQDRSRTNRKINGDDRLRLDLVLNDFVTSAFINKNINMDHLIANDEDDYVEKAKSLIFDKKLNEKYGVKLRDKALKSPLFDTNKFTKNFFKLFRFVFIFFIYNI